MEEEIIDGFALDISNDPEIERLGANATAVYALQFWKRLAQAARKDSHLLDPLWQQEADEDDDDDEEKIISETNGDENTSSNNSHLSCHYTKELVLVSPEEDVRLWKRFRSNFGAYFNIQDIAVAEAGSGGGNSMVGRNPLVSDRWRDLILALEGGMDDYNFLTLLRGNCYDCFWMTETAVCDNLLVVPRAQFVLIEVTRIREGLYHGKFRKALQGFDLQSTSKVLKDYMDHQNDSTNNNRNTTAPSARMVWQTVQRLQQDWPYCPPLSRFKKSGLQRSLRGILQQQQQQPTQDALTNSDQNISFCHVQQACQALWDQWRDIYRLGQLHFDKSFPTSPNASKQTKEQIEALERATKALIRRPDKQQDSQAVVSPSEKKDNRDSTPKPITMETVTTTVRVDHDDDKVDERIGQIFDEYGMVIVPDLLTSLYSEDNHDGSSTMDTLLDSYRQQADKALEQLQRDKLDPLGLSVNGAEAFDMVHVRQRPGHRVDNRYGILSDSQSPLAQLAQKLAQQLGRLLFPTEGEGDAASSFPTLKVLHGGVVHAFARASQEDPVPPAQFWHRDGPSLFANPQKHHPTHCFNVFVPLINVDEENGTTEFVPRSHVDAYYNEWAPDLVLWAQQQDKDKNSQHAVSPCHERAIRALVPAGSAIVFDVRVFHRGLANLSLQDRPVLYFTLARDWFQEQHMFAQEGEDEKQESPQTIAEKEYARAACHQLYRLVMSKDVPNDSTDDVAGHPHYTTRFDLHLWEEQQKQGRQEPNYYMAAMTFVLTFLNCSETEKHDMYQELIAALLNPASRERKQEVLATAKAARKRAQTDKDDEEKKDFASISTDLSDVQALYQLTGTMWIMESPSLARRAGSLLPVNEFSVCFLLALFKAHEASTRLGKKKESSTGAAQVPSVLLEEAFSSWWHGGKDRFAFWHDKPNDLEARAECNLLVVFSSLGSGLARPEWNGTIQSFLSKQQQEPKDNTTIGGTPPQSKWHVLQVLDPAFSWYSQDPTCQWQGYSYYLKELTQRVAGYRCILYLGDSMGGGAALRFSSLAHGVLCFTPQIDLQSYPAITRCDFTSTLRQDYQTQILESVQGTASSSCKQRTRYRIHYGRYCPEDVRQVSLLSSTPLQQPASNQQENLQLIAHDYDDHVLSLHLREQGVLSSLVEEALVELAAAVEQGS